MTALNRTLGTRTAVPTFTLNSLANDTYLASAAIDLVSAGKYPLDVIFEAEITPGTVSGDKAAPFFVQYSMDGGSSWTTGPTSGTSATDEPNLYGIGSLPLNTNSTLQRGTWSLFQALGFIPTQVKLVCRNRSGAAFAASGCAAYYRTVSGDQT